MLELVKIQARFEHLAQFVSPELRSVVEDCANKINEIVTTAGVESLLDTVRPVKRKKMDKGKNSSKPTTLGPLIHQETRQVPVADHSRSIEEQEDHKKS